MKIHFFHPTDMNFHFIIKEDTIRNGISLSRNSKLADVFHRLRFIESYGTGIRRIYALYQGSGQQPMMSITPNSFKMTLPNMNVSGKTDTSSLSGAVGNNQTKVEFKLTPQMKAVLEFITEHGEISSKETQMLLDVKETRAYVILKQLIDAGIIEKVGRGKDKRYVHKVQDC